MAVAVCQHILMSSQVCVKVRRHWPAPEWGALQSSAAISTPHPLKERAQISSPFMWWSGCALATMSPSSSNLECTLRGFTQTTRVSSDVFNHALLLQLNLRRKPISWNRLILFIYFIYALTLGPTTGRFLW